MFSAHLSAVAGCIDYVYCEGDLAPRRIVSGASEENIMRIARFTDFSSMPQIINHEVSSVGCMQAATMCGLGVFGVFINCILEDLFWLRNV